MVVVAHFVRPLLLLLLLLLLPCQLNLLHEQEKDAHERQTQG